MTRIAFVNMGSYLNQVGRAKTFTEPVHLLAMHGICEKAGHQSMVYQFGFPSVKKSIRAIVEPRPDIVALSFFGYQEEDLAGAHQLLSAFPGYSPRLIVGGPDIQYYSHAFAQEFNLYYSKDNPAVFVAGPGEQLIMAMAANNFASPSGSNDNAGAIFISLQAFIPLVEQSFLRPYPDLSAFNSRVQVKWQQGCWGTCGFCSNEYRPIDYRPPDQVLAEIKHAKQLKALMFHIAGENFTADPKRSSDIAAVLPRGKEAYLFGSRIDSLYKAITEYPKAWKGLITRISLGAESFLPVRLGPVRMHKYASQKDAEAQLQKLEYIADFLKDEKVVLELFLIPYDWQMTLEELEEEITQVIAFCEKHPNIKLILGNLSGVLHFEPGSAFSKKMQWEDFFCFQLDPRPLMLACLMEQKVNELYRAFGSKIELEEATIALVMWEYLRVCLQRLKAVPVTQFDIKPIVDIFSRGDNVDEALEEFYSQLGREDGAVLRQEFDHLFLFLKDEINKKIIKKSIPFPLSLFWWVTKVLRKRQ